MKRVTRQRLEIQRVIAQAGRPLSPLEILETARQRIPTLSLATIYRNLRELQDARLLAPVPMPGNITLYEGHEAQAHHHHHFQCNQCRRVFDIEGCPGGLEGMLPAGFVLDRHEVTLYGTCADCARPVSVPD
ncbi:MAG: transcriptional repressor [Lautropia sp.]|nr:transcriptional repressor [Lautropia sp.]